MRFKNLAGQRFGRWTALKRSENKCGRVMWACKCDCGKVRDVISCNLVAGKTKSCGCLDVEVLVARSTTHGDTKGGYPTKEYRAWRHMLNRCHRKVEPNYNDYGGRGITVCGRWRGSYENFLEDMGRCPKEMSLDRKNNNGNYEPSNCRWATNQEQAGNKRTNVWVEGAGILMIQADWLSAMDVSRARWNGIKKRRGLTQEETLNFFLKEVPNGKCNEAREAISR